MSERDDDREGRNRPRPEPDEGSGRGEPTGREPDAGEGSLDKSGAFRVIVWRAVFQATGLSLAGRRLVRALGSRDETVRTVAAMSLVQAGHRSIPLLCESLVRRQHLALALQALGDIGEPRVEPAIAPFAIHPDPEVAQAAKDALRILHAHKARHDP